MKMKGQTRWFFLFNYILLFIYCSCPNFPPFAPHQEEQPHFQWSQSKEQEEWGEDRSGNLHELRMDSGGEKEGLALNSVDNSRAFHSTSTLLLYPEHYYKH